MALSQSTKRCFNIFDLNHDGVIDENEMMNVFEQLGIKLTHDQFMDLMSDVDYNTDGKIDLTEFQVFFERMLGRCVRSKSEIEYMHKIRQDGMAGMCSKLSQRKQSRPEREIKHVVFIVVVVDEIRSILEKYNTTSDAELNEKFLGLCCAHVARIGNESGDGYNLTVLQVGHSTIYNRHYSGPSHSAAITALAMKILDPDIIVSFGTAGGMPPYEIGDVVLGNGTVFLDRVRSSSKNAFDWGIYGGKTMAVKNMPSDIGLKEGLVGSQLSYKVSREQEELIKILKVACIDMEAASEAQILDQCEINFVVLKVISNLTYPSDPDRMEMEYIEHREEVSKKGVEAIDRMLRYMVGKRIGDL